MGKGNFMSNIPARMRERLEKQNRYNCSLFPTNFYVDRSLKRCDGFPNVHEPPTTVKKPQTAERPGPIKLKSILKVTTAPPTRKQPILTLKMPLLYWQQMRKMENRKMVKRLKAERRATRKDRKVHNMPRICEAAEIAIENKKRYKAVVIGELLLRWQEGKERFEKGRLKRNEAAMATWLMHSSPTLSDSTLGNSREEWQGEPEPQSKYVVRTGGDSALMVVWHQDVLASLIQGSNPALYSEVDEEFSAAAWEEEEEGDEQLMPELNRISPNGTKTSDYDVAEWHDFEEVHFEGPEED